MIAARRAGKARRSGAEVFGISLLDVSAAGEVRIGALMALPQLPREQGVPPADASGLTRERQ
jgi:hypothetical protein